jgi:hypothetical protein
VRRRRPASATSPFRSPCRPAAPAPDRRPRPGATLSYSGATPSGASRASPLLFRWSISRLMASSSSYRERAEFAPPLQQVGGEERFAKPRLIVPPSPDRQAVLGEGLDLVVRAAGQGHAAAQGVEYGGNHGRRSVRTGLATCIRSLPEDAETLGCHVSHREQLLSALRECRLKVW